jgi:diguanylate cyclase (GGDEF)-like protein
VRPLTRRAHVRVPGATAGRVERLAFGSAPDSAPPMAAISVVPGATLPAALHAIVGGADLDAVLGGEESGCAPGRHRRPNPMWSFLQNLPGFRSIGPASSGTPDDEDAAVFGDRPMNEPHADAEDGEALDDSLEDSFDTPDLDDSADLDDIAEFDHLDDAEADLPLVPGPRPEPQQPAHLRRRRRSPSPVTRAALQVAARRIEDAPDAPTIGRVACEEAARLVDADVTALVLRAVEGPRVLWLHPGGPDADGLWGPATLAGLLGVAQPVRRVVEGDPLADGAPTALLTMPVPSGGALVGTLVARRHEARIFSAGEQDILNRVARMAGAALRAASRPAPRGPQSDDPVTGLPLGRRFAADAEAAVRTAERQGMAVSVLAVHVDGLSRIRTDLGEQTADDVLRALAAAVQPVLRVGDLAYRLGSDELALLLPATDAVALAPVRERLDAVAAEVFERLSLPGGRRHLTLRTARVSLHDVGPGRSVVDAALRSLELDRQKVRWSPAG